MHRKSVDYGGMYRILEFSGKSEGVLGLRETPWSFMVQSTWAPYSGPIDISVEESD
jgi:hypothetical protein